jgi:hypothetical protein
MWAGIWSVRAGPDLDVAALRMLVTSLISSPDLRTQARHFGKHAGRDLAIVVNAVIPNSAISSPSKLFVPSRGSQSPVSSMLVILSATCLCGCRLQPSGRIRSKPATAASGDCPDFMIVRTHLGVFYCDRTRIVTSSVSLGKTNHIRSANSAR